MAPADEAFRLKLRNRRVATTASTPAGVAKWQTHRTQNAAGQPVRVRIPLPAPEFMNRPLNTDRALLANDVAYTSPNDRWQVEQYLSAAGTYRFFSDREQIEVILPDRVWFGHILTNHPEMTGQERAIELTLQNPDVVNRDSVHRDRRNHYCKCAVTGFQEEVIVKVVVQYTAAIWGTWQGVITTAYVTDAIPEHEERLWPDGKP